MSSKTSKVVNLSKSAHTCQYTLVRGENKGKKCGKGCRGEFCNDHNKNKKQYIKKYSANKNQEVRKNTMLEKIKGVGLGEGEIPDIKKIELLSLRKVH